ncbi:MAG: hypothetical protein UU71_C0001G0013 [Parcubacteria group bacterium GW2011_GWB1_41_6]|nr:MAG: hypothetical protein UU71_C0001G0013 [Parcubacteria group bacterium GW2011_GWB1_41_6]KKS34504.1 MAG: hypothetical protein UU96_C0003G0013 [Parcubacteria group bacterium GW2011_GWC2_42_13]KKS57899.1 MAG: hypothetical protein UV22_C0010G0007 [Parcubacteria group bacterium GW2011_GWA2_42_35]
MEIRIIKKPISKEELKELAKEGFGDVVKAVVDVEQEIMAVGGELHADEEILLMDKENSKRENTWGVNFYPDKSENDFIEFDSMINLKPAFGNRSRDVENSEIKIKIKKIVEKLITD